jgi:hypothetical protein
MRKTIPAGRQRAETSVAPTGFKPEDNGYENDIIARQNKGHFQTQKNPLPERVLRNRRMDGDPDWIKDYFLTFIPSTR